MPTEKHQVHATMPKGMMGFGCSLLYRQSSQVFSAMEGGAMNTCLRVLKAETKWILSFS